MKEYYLLYLNNLREIFDFIVTLWSEAQAALGALPSVWSINEENFLSF